MIKTITDQSCHVSMADKNGMINNQHNAVGRAITAIQDYQEYNNDINTIGLLRWPMQRS